MERGVNAVVWEISLGKGLRLGLLSNFLNEGNFKESLPV